MKPLPPIALAALLIVPIAVAGPLLIDCAPQRETTIVTRGDYTLHALVGFNGTATPAGCSDLVLNGALEATYEDREGGNQTQDRIRHRVQIAMAGIDLAITGMGVQCPGNWGFTLDGRIPRPGLALELWCETVNNNSLAFSYRLNTTGLADSVLEETETTWSDEETGTRSASTVTPLTASVTAQPLPIRP